MPYSIPDNNFNFNPEKFDFREICECISMYYPAGISNEAAGAGQSFKGSKSLADIIVDHTHNQHNFKERWVSFDAEMARSVDKEVMGATYGRSPCFNSYIVIEKYDAGGLIRYKELHYFISFIGKFYTVIGIDHNEVATGNDVFRSVNYLVVSPVDVFAELFTTVCEVIEKKLNTYRFVPFSICKQKIARLNAGDQDEVKDRVFDAIFGSSFISAGEPNISGDEDYKASDWIIPGYADAGSSWTIYPPGSFPGDAG